MVEEIKHLLYKMLATCDDLPRIQNVSSRTATIIYLTQEVQQRGWCRELEGSSEVV